MSHWATPDSELVDNAPTGCCSDTGMIRLIAVTVFISFIAIVSFAQDRPMNPPAIATLKNRVKETAGKTNTIACDFSQVKEMGMISEKIVSSGKFWLKKERKLRWEYLKPYEYLIIMRNDEIIIRDETRVNQFNARSNKVFSEINRIILGSVQGTLLEDEISFSSAFFENASAYVVRLKTLSPKLKESLAEITIHFDRNDFTVVRLDMNEPGGDFTRITFTSKKLNQPIPDEIFFVH